jgi:uncharacterized membrane protein YhaH (DUF805 family)
MNYYLTVLQKYAEFNGRASRSEYWYFVLYNLLISIAIGAVAGLVKLPILGTIYSLAVLVPGIAVGIRRMHDVDKSGWHLLIPFYNLYLACIEGTRGDNQYGEDPWGNKGAYMPTSGVLDDKV